MPPGDNIVFSLKGLGKSFGSFQALDNINLEIKSGEQVALVGPSGAGKSTLIRLLNGTLLPSAGEITVLGHDLPRLRPRARRLVQRRIGTIYQQFYLTESLRVVHNVNAGHLGRWPLWKSAISLVRPFNTERAAQALEQVGIPEKLYDRTGQLSGGQQQRVALARVLVQNPDVILADEPVSSLDPERSREIMDLLRDLSRSGGKTLVSSIHAVQFAASHFERVVGLRQGRIVFDCDAGEVTPSMIEALYRIDDATVRGALPEQLELSSAYGPPDHFGHD
ncbi:MAG TPA: phosphonate ABC transporter ATP-binding protein [Chloroflexia bacterium]|nr:phosphonate ABC transporter ATP-binding protein [Chloroflexia bacterium]